MMDSQIAPDANTAAFVQISRPTDTFQAALAYHQAGLCVIPLNGKRPALEAWKLYQAKRPSEDDLLRWQSKKLLGNIGVVCGAVSGKLVVMDFDGPGAYAAFAAVFPNLAQSYTVATGSGKGKHVYLYADDLPPTTRALDTPIGHIELRAEGCYVAAPPSRHPVTGKLYEVEKALDILRVPDLAELVAWIEAFKPKQPDEGWQPPKHLPPLNSTINPELVGTIADRLRQRRYKERGEWINCSCVYPERHSNGDKHPSFGFSTASGYGYCYRCGTILAKDLCERLDIDPCDCGGLLKRPEMVLSIDHTVAGEQVTPPPPPTNLPTLSGIALPDWLSQYTTWASRVGNQTPIAFHQAAGIWLLSVAIARRLYVEAPWGVRLYSNLYMMLVADTTFYRKTTAYKLAENAIRQAIPHMLMPTPGSPERFQDMLAGRLPTNYKELTYQQQELLSQARSFAAQRGLFKDEVAGLFGAFSRRDYMYGMKDLIMELYDCPDYSDKDTQTGLTIVKDAALSILGVTTPAGLVSAVTDTDWQNGLLPRFLMLTPEPDYAERPALNAHEPVPEGVVAGLKALYERLPMPQQTGDGWEPPAALKVETQCWNEVQAYSNRLRKLCDPHHETPLDDRLKGVYGRMHVQAVKLSMILAALDWMKSDAIAPTITLENWQTAGLVAEHWRASAHRLLDHLDRSGSGRDERRQQDRVYEAIRESGRSGVMLREVYRKLNMKALDARQAVQELTKAGLVAPAQIGTAEGYIAVQGSGN